MLLLALADIGCSSSFWKNLEPMFAPVSLENMSYLKHLVGAFTISAFVNFNWHLMEAFFPLLLCYT